MSVKINDSKEQEKTEPEKTVEQSAKEGAELLDSLSEETEEPQVKEKRGRKR